MGAVARLELDVMISHTNLAGHFQVQKGGIAMIIGAHSIIYSKSPELDRAFLRDVLELPHVDLGGGWLIFGLPPAEVALHPSSKNDVHEFYLMCDDVEALIGEMKKRSISCEPGAEPGLGVAHARYAAGRREARHLSAATRTTEGDGREEQAARTCKTGY